MDSDSRPGSHPGQGLGRRDRLVLPAQVSHHRIAGLKTRMPGDRYPSHDLTHQHLSQLHRFRIGLAVVQAPAHVGIEREIDAANEALSRPGGRKRGGNQLEVRQPGHAPGTSRQNDLSVGESCCPLLCSVGEIRQVSAPLTDRVFCKIGSGPVILPATVMFCPISIPGATW